MLNIFINNYKMKILIKVLNLIKLVTHHLVIFFHTKVNEKIQENKIKTINILQKILHPLYLKGIKMYRGKNKLLKQ